MAKKIKKKVVQPKEILIAEKKVSFKNKVIAFAELMRIGNCIMAAIAVLIGFFLANGLDYRVAAIAAFSTLLICGAGQTINDYFDSEIDEKTSKHRPIPSGRVTKKQALYFSIVLFFIGILLSALVNSLTTLVALIFTILLIAYPMFMNKIKYLGNIVVALGTGVTFIYGASATGNIPFIVFLVFTSAFFSNMAREVTKDIEDVKKDKGTKITLPMITKNAKNYVLIYYIAAISLSLVIYIWFKLSYLYLAFAIISTAIFIYALMLLFNNSPKKSQQTSKAGMLASLVAFVFAGFK